MFIAVINFSPSDYLSSPIRPGCFWVIISLRAAVFKDIKFTIIVPIRGGVVKEEHPFKFLDISNNIYNFFKPHILIFDYIPNYTHPFYPILIPNTPYVKVSLILLFVGGPKNLN